MVRKKSANKQDRKPIALSKEVNPYHRSLLEALRNLQYNGIFDGSNEDLAAKLDFAKSTISSYRKGKISLSKPFIQKFEDVFKINLTSDSAGSVVPIKREINDFAKGIETRVIALEATTHVLKLKIVDLITDVSSPRKPASEVFEQLDREIRERGRVLLDQLQNK